VFHDGVLAVFDGLLALEELGLGFGGVLVGDGLSLGPVLPPQADVEAVLVILAVTNSFTHNIIYSVQNKAPISTPTHPF